MVSNMKHFLKKFLFFLFFRIYVYRFVKVPNSCHIYENLKQTSCDRKLINKNCPTNPFLAKKSYDNVKKKLNVLKWFHFKEKKLFDSCRF